MQMGVNFLGAFRVSRAVLPQMRERGEGLLIHVTSILGRIVFPGCGVYCASKSALEALAEVRQYELGGQESSPCSSNPAPTRPACSPTARVLRTPPSPAVWAAGDIS